MFLYRVVRNKFSDDLSGTGSKIHGGRWNSPGIPALYTSESKSLAVLESLANAPSVMLATDFSIITLQVSGNFFIEEIALKDLPANWNSYPAPINLVKLGDNWLIAKKNLLLKIPSCIIESEYNFIINPMHPDMKKVKFTATEKLVLNKRVSENS